MILDSYTFVADAELLANYEDAVKYTISFNKNGGTGTMSSKTVSQGGSYSLPSCTFTPPSGKTFNFWGTSSSATSGKQSGTTVYNVTANTTWYAIWKTKTYTISFNKNGGSGTMSSKTVNHGSSYSLPSCTFTPPSGKAFNFWGTSSTATSGKQPNTTVSNVTANATWYAIWTAAPSLEQRVLSRHSSNQGSVVTVDMYGKTVQLFVADAKYRAFKAWASGSTYGTDIPSLSNFTSDVKFINPNNTNDNDTQPLSYTMSDTQLQARFPSFKTDKTAKQNTDILMQYSDTAAAHWCRSQNISGVGQMNLPNIYELMVLYLESDRIDALDPTVNSYKQYALGKLNTYGRFNFNNNGVCWSSTEYSSTSARCVNFSGYVSYDSKSNVHGVIPVKELSVY